MKKTAQNQVILYYISANISVLARLRSGHLRSMTFVQGVKSFFACPCSLLASPAHLLDCWGISLRQLYEEQERSNGLGVGFPAPRGLETTTTHSNKYVFYLL
ncbi:uncharacterized protein TNCV_562891 [Trichonephila clavipes]|nr:uncharacterized protein TNCV_562891 [Trichonephila clavipes]